MVRRVMLIVASALLGMALIVVLLRLAKSDLHQTYYQLENVNRAAFARLILLNGVLALLSTEKWRSVDAVLRVPSDSAPSRLTAFSLTSAGLALGFLLPVQVGMAAARTMGTYLHGRPLQRGTAGTLFEQSFDLLVVFFLAVASGVTWLWHAGAEVWTTTAVVMIILALLLVSRYMRLLRWLSGYVARRLPDKSQLATRLNEVSELDDSGVLSSSLARKLVLLSAVRFAVLVLMAAQTADAIGVRISLWQMAAVIPFVVVSNVLAITPGGIGVNELTSVSVLTRFGTPLAIAAQWSLANRFLIMASSFALVALAVPIVIFGRMLREGEPTPGYKTEVKGI